MQNEIIRRDNGNRKIFLSEESIDVVDILNGKYSYIYDSIRNEGFILKYGQCNLFKELLCDNMVVGFCSYDFSREFMTASLNNIYVMPQYRGNGIFIREIQETLENHSKPSIMEPTRLIVELLIMHGFAKKLSEDIVASAIEFVIPGENVLTNGHYENEELSTHFYDLDVCASIHVLDFENLHVAYSAPLNYDIINYDCIEKRECIDDDYFLQITEFFEKGKLEVVDALVDLEENLAVRNYTLEEVVGDEDGFSPYIQSLIDDAHITPSKAVSIKRQIREEYEAGMILNESLMIRLAYLFDESVGPTIKSHDETCPYCGMPIDAHDRFCHFCGINLDYDAVEMENSLINSINSSDDFSEDIRFIAYKFLRLVDEKINLDYSIFTIENTYNITWDELKAFLERNNYFRKGFITDEGYEFLDTHPLYFFEKYRMDIVDYSDFENYFYDNPDMHPVDRCLGYLNLLDDDEYVRELIDEIGRDS